MSRKMHISFKENDNDLKLYLLAQSYKDKSAYVKTALEFYEKYKHLIPYLDKLQKKAESEVLIKLLKEK